MRSGGHGRLIDTMTGTPHIYIETDVPEGMTLSEWRRSSGGDRRRTSFWRRLLALGGPQFA